MNRNRSHKAWAVIFWVILAPGRAFADPVQRDVDLDPKQEIHPVTVVGGHGVGTNIRFPDSFEEKNVVCGGQCIVIKPGESAAAVAEESVQNDPRNWVMEINTGARLISVRPKHLPTVQDNPAQSFTTNLYVKLDGGHVVNLTLRLLSLHEGETRPDGVVNLLLPASESLEGKLKAKTDELEAQFTKRLTEGIAQRFAESLGQGVNCRAINWLAKAHRNDGIAVFIREVCSTKGDTRLFWVVFDVENRSDRGIRLASATLSAVNTVEKERIVNKSHFFKHDPLFFGDENRGVATAALLPQEHHRRTDGPTLLNKWALTVETTSGDVVVAEDLLF